MSMRKIILFFGFSLLLAGAVGAATRAKEDNSVTLDDNASWRGARPIVGDVALFDNRLATATNTTLSLGLATSTWGQIQFVDPVGNVTIVPGSGVQLQGLAGVGIDMSAATRDLTFGAQFILGADQSWNIAAGRSLWVNGAVTNASGTNAVLTKQGAGLLHLGGTNSFAGAGRTNVLSAGILSVGSPAALGQVSSVLLVAGGTNLLASDLSITTYPVSVAASGGFISDKASPGTTGITHRFGPLTVGGFAVSVAAGTNVSGGTAGLAFGTTLLTGNVAFAVGSGAQLELGALTGAFAVAKSGVGTLVLTTNAATNRTTTAAAVTNTGGQIVFGAPAVLGATSVPFTVNGGVFDLASDTSVTSYNVLVQGSVTVTPDKATAGSAGITHSLGRLTIGSNTLSVAPGDNVGSGVAGVTFNNVGLTGNVGFAVATNALLRLGTVSGAFTVAKSGTGVLVLTNAAEAGRSTSASAVTLTDGELRIGQVAALGTAAVPLNLNGGVLGLAVDATVNAHNVTVGGNTVINSDKATAGGAGITNTLGTLTIGASTLGITDGTNVASGRAGVSFGNTTFSAAPPTFDVASGTILLLGALQSAGSFVKTNSGNLTLNAAAAAARTSGTATLAAGTLTLANTNALGSTGTLLQLNAGVLDLAADTSMNAYNVSVGADASIAPGRATAGAGLVHGLGALTIGASTLTVTGGVNVSSGTTAVRFASVTLTNSPVASIKRSATGGTLLVLGATTDDNAGHTLTVAGDGALGQTGVWSGAMSLTLGSSFSGTTTLSQANTFAGDVTLSAGMLKLAVSSVLPDGAGKGNLVFNPASGTATLDLAGFSDTINGLSSSGGGSSIIDITTAAGSSTLTVGSNNQSSTFSGVLRNSAGTLSLAKTGSGTLTLAGSASTYTGTTAVLDGTLSVSSIVVNAGQSALGNSTGAVVLGSTASTGTLSYTGGSTNYVRGFLLGAGGGNLFVEQAASTVTVSGAAINNVSNGLFTIGGPGQVTMSSVLGGGSGGLRKIGAGTLTLSGGTNTFTGATLIEQGTVRASNIVVTGGRSDFGNAASAVTLGGTTSSATLLYAGSSASFTRGFTLGAGGARVEIESSGQTLTLASGAIDNTTGGSLTLAGAGSALITSVLGGGAGSLVKSGTGALTLSGGNNTYTGPTTLQQGTVTAGVVTVSGGKSDFGNASSAIALGSTTNSATLVYNGTSATFTRGLTVGAGGGRLDVLTGGQTLTISGAAISLSAGGSITLGGAGDASVSSTIGAGAGGLTKLGSGTLTLSGSNTFDGAVTLSAGRIALGHAAALGSTAGATTVADGSTLDLRGTSITLAETINLNGTGTDGAGSLVNLGSSTSTLAGAVALQTAASIGGGADVVLQGALSGSAALTKAGTNVLVLQGNNTGFSGSLLVTTGIVRTANAGALGSTAAGTVVSSGAALDLNGVTISSAEPVTLSGSGVAGDGVLRNESATSASLAGPVTLAASSIVGGVGDVTLSGGISGAFDLEKTSTNVLTLSGDSAAYSNVIRVRFGTLKVGHAGALGTAGGATIVSNGATLDLNGTTITRLEPVSIGGSGVGGAGMLVNGGAAAASLAGPVTLTAAGLLGGPGDFSLGGALQGGYDVAKTGTNTVTLSGDNAGYTNRITVSNGVLRVGHGSALGSTNESTVIVPGAALDLGGIDSTNAERVLVGGAGPDSTGAIINEAGDEIHTAFSLVLQTNTTVGGSRHWNTTGGVTGGYNLTKVGTNEVDINGDIAHSGLTFVSNGVLHFTHITSTGTVVVSGDGWLGGTGIVDHAVIITNGGTISPGHPDVGILQVGSLVINSNTHLDVEIHVTGAHAPGDTNNVEAHEDVIQVNDVNGLTINGGSVHLQREGTTNTFDTSGRYPLFHAVGTVAGSVSNLVVANQSGGKEYIFSRFSTTVVVTIRTTIGWDGLGEFYPVPDLTWQNPDNWAFANVPSNYDRVVFTGSSSGLTNYFNLGPDFVASGLVFTNGAGRFVLRQETGWPHTLRVVGAILNMSSETMTFEMPFNFDDSSQSIICSNGPIVIKGNIGEHDAGYGLTKEGAFDLTLSGTNTYSGVTTLQRGTLKLQSAAALSSTGNITFAGGTLQFSALNTNDYSARIRDSTGAIRIDDNGQNLTLVSTLDASNTNGFTKLGTGTLRLSAANAFGGAVSVENGTLTFSSMTNLGAGSALNLGAATLRWNDGNAADISTRAVSFTQTNGVLDIGTNNVAFAAGIGQGSTGGFVKAGAGRLTLSASNNFAGGLVLSNGTLSLNHARALGSGPLSIAGGALDNTSGASVTNAGGNAQRWRADVTFLGSANLDLGSGDVTLVSNRSITVVSNTLAVGALSDTGLGYALTKQGSGTLRLYGATNHVGGGLSVSAGTLQVDGVATDAAVSVATSARLAGEARLGHVALSAGAILVPGPVSRPGLLVATSIVFGAGSYLELGFTNAQAGATEGVDASQLRVGSSGTNRVDISSLTTNAPLVVRVSAPSSLPGWDPLKFREWKVLAAGGWNGTFDRRKFRLDTTNWLPDLAGGELYLAESNGNLYVRFDLNLRSTQILATATSRQIAWTWTESNSYDVLYTEAANFSDSLTNGWTLLTNITGAGLVDSGSLSNGLFRFYRAAQPGRWTTNNVPRRASLDVLAARDITLVPGENWISLPVEPAVNTIAAMLGTNRLPAAATVVDATRVSWFSVTNNAQATSTVWLASSGNWMYSVGGSGVANDKTLPLQEGFVVEIPGTSTQRLTIIGRVTTNVLTYTVGPGSATAGREVYALRSVSVPRSYTMAQSGLRGAVTAGINILSADEIRVLDNSRGQGSKSAPKARIYLRSSDNQFLLSTGASAEGYVVQPFDTLLIVRHGTGTMTATNALPYSRPTRDMSP